MSTLLFLDLEETVIESWDNPLLMNVSNVREFIASARPTAIGIFSWAIWSEDDRTLAKTEIIPVLNKVFNISIDLSFIPTKDETISGAVAPFKWDNDIHESLLLSGNKGLVFQEWVRKANLPFDKIILLDDMVPNLSITDKSTNQTIDLVNVKDLFK